MDKKRIGGWLSWGAYYWTLVEDKVTPLNFPIVWYNDYGGRYGISTGYKANETSKFFEGEAGYPLLADVKGIRSRLPNTTLVLSPAPAGYDSHISEDLMTGLATEPTLVDYFEAFEMGEDLTDASVKALDDRIKYIRSYIPGAKVAYGIEGERVKSWSQAFLDNIKASISLLTPYDLIYVNYGYYCGVEMDIITKYNLLKSMFPTRKFVWTFGCRNITPNHRIQHIQNAMSEINQCPDIVQGVYFDIFPGTRQFDLDMWAAESKTGDPYCLLDSYGNKKNGYDYIAQYNGSSPPTPPVPPSICVASRNEDGSVGWQCTDGKKGNFGGCTIKDPIESTYNSKEGILQVKVVGCEPNPKKYWNNSVNVMTGIVTGWVQSGDITPPSPPSACKLTKEDLESIKSYLKEIDGKLTSIGEDTISVSILKGRISEILKKT